ncbi:MAG: ATP-binding cassette domain-containing protein [Parachlamydiaceae bacterium]
MIKLQKICKQYLSGKRMHCAVDGVDLHIRQGETLGLVGESGSGKSTLGKIILGLEQPTSGQLLHHNKERSKLTKREVQQLCKEMQVVFQDPYSSLNPRMTVEDIVGEGMDIHKIATGTARREKIISLLTAVGLEPSMMQRFPHQFSGGQRQRICIARALAVDPGFIVCDEPLSALDIQTQRQIMALFKQLKRDMGLTFLFISHDLHAVRSIADNIAVMHCGQIVEYAPTEELFAAPKHPYTQKLLESYSVRKHGTLSVKVEGP